MKVTHMVVAHAGKSEPIDLFRVENSTGAAVEFINWGARWIRAFMPDAGHVMGNVLLGYDALSDYLTDSYYMGAVVGRYANRIAGASFTIADTTYHLEANDGQNTNHGGHSGFHHKRWQWEVLPDGVRFSLFSPDGEGGYPGNVNVSVTYRLSEENVLAVNYRGTTDRVTYLNLTHHAYFNLSGVGEAITNHRLLIPATHLLETTAAFIPTGKKIAVAGTPFDFTHSKRIGEELHTDNEQLRQNRGYNHCYILKEQSSVAKVLAASLVDPETGRKLTVETDLPGVLLYTAGYYERPDTGVCFETQFFPDTPHYAHFPSCLLHPSEVYEQNTYFRFDNNKR